MTKVKCQRCGVYCTEVEASLLDLSMVTRAYNYKQESSSSMSRRTSICLCPACKSELSDASSSYMDQFLAVLQGKVQVFPFRLPKVGDKVYEVVDGSYPIVVSVITKYEDGWYEATAKNIEDAGTIRFAPADIGRNLFLTKKAAEAEKTRRKDAK